MMKTYSIVAKQLERDEITSQERKQIVENKVSGLRIPYQGCKDTQKHCTDGCAHYSANPHPNDLINPPESLKSSEFP